MEQEEANMTSTDEVHDHVHCYVCLGLQIALAPGIQCRFPMIQAARGTNGNGAKRPEHEPVRPTNFWIMAIIPFNEVTLLSDPMLQNLIEFWNAEVIEIGNFDERGGRPPAPRPATNGHRTVVTVIHDRALVTEQHVVKANANGFEATDGIRLTVRPAADEVETVLTISRGDEPLSAQRVTKSTTKCFVMRDASAGTLTGTIHKTTAGGIPLTDARGRMIRRLTAKDLMAMSRRSGLGEPSVHSSVSYGLTPAEEGVGWGEVHSRRQLECILQKNRNGERP
jgi:hypothetical protein